MGIQFNSYPDFENYATKTTLFQGYGVKRQPRLCELLCELDQTSNNGNHSNGGAHLLQLWHL